MDTQEFRDAAKAAIDHSQSPPPQTATNCRYNNGRILTDNVYPVLNYYENIQDHSVVSQVEPGYLRAILPTSAPEDGEAWDVIRKDIDTKIVPGLTHW